MPVLSGLVFPEDSFFLVLDAVDERLFLIYLFVELAKLMSKSILPFNNSFGVL